MKNDIEIYFDDVRRIVYNIQWGNLSQIAVLFCDDIYTNDKFKDLCDYLLKGIFHIIMVKFLYKKYKIKLKTKLSSKYLINNTCNLSISLYR